MSSLQLEHRSGDHGEHRLPRWRWLLVALTVAALAAPVAVVMAPVTATATGGRGRAPAARRVGAATVVVRPAAGRPTVRWSPRSNYTILATGSIAGAGPAAPPAAGSASAHLRRACPAARRATAAVKGAVTLDQVGNHYGIGSLVASGHDGSGATIAALELAPVSERDIAVYDRCFDLPAFEVGIRLVGRGGAPGQGTAEADVDVEQLQTQAPFAHVIVYEGPNSGAGFATTLAAIVRDDRAQVVSISWGACEAVAGRQIRAMRSLFAQAARQGQTVVVASGDTGSEGCLALGSTALSVQYPASDPNVTAVGGTVPHPGGPDDVWNACARATSTACAVMSSLGTGPRVPGASGGGVSRVFTHEPAFQQQAGSFGGRAVPDISADASAAVGVVGGRWVVGAGTSLSAPLVAGLVADVLPTYATPIGDLAPKLYAYAGEGGYGTVLSPVASGNNDFTDSYRHRHYAARPGHYSPAAGLGTPIAAGFLAPQVTGLSSEVAPAGARLTIEGTDLEHTTVRFGPAPATVVSASPGSITVEVPPGSGPTGIVVSNPIGSAAPQPFAYAPVGTPAVSTPGP